MGRGAPRSRPTEAKPTEEPVKEAFQEEKKEDPVVAAPKKEGSIRKFFTRIKSGRKERQAAKIAAAKKALGDRIEKKKEETPKEEEAKEVPPATEEKAETSTPAEDETEKKDPEATEEKPEEESPKEPEGEAPKEEDVNPEEVQDQARDISKADSGNQETGVFCCAFNWFATA